MPKHTKMTETLHEKGNTVYNGYALTPVQNQLSGKHCSRSGAIQIRKGCRTRYEHEE